MEVGIETFPFEPRGSVFNLLNLGQNLWQAPNINQFLSHYLPVT